MHPFLPNVCSKANDTHTHIHTHTHIYTLCTVYMYMRHSAWPHHWTFQRSNPSPPSSCPASCASASCARFVPGGALAELPSGMERHDLRAPFFPAAWRKILWQCGTIGIATAAPAQPPNSRGLISCFNRN